MTSYLVSGASALGGEPVDLLLLDGRFVDPADAPAGAVRIDAGGLVALPGLVDLHTHLREPGREDAETVDTARGRRARGGYTAVHAMANTDPVADTAGVVEQVFHLGGGVRVLRRAAGRRGHRRARRATAGRAGRDGRLARPRYGSSPTTARACPMRCSCGGRSSTSRRSTG